MQIDREQLLRDQFALTALKVLLPMSAGELSEMFPEAVVGHEVHVSTASYVMADRMMKARDRDMLRRRRIEEGK